MNDELCNLPGLAIRLKLPADWLRAEAEAGRIPCLRIGRKLRFNPSAVRTAVAKLAARSIAVGNSDKGQRP